jgi:hypothetical protein
MGEEDKIIRRHDLGGSTALNLIESETDGNAAVEEFACVA